MAPSRVAGGIGQSSSSSGIFFQADGQAQGIANSHLSSSFVNSSNSIPCSGHSSLGPISGEMNNAVLNNVANSGPSMGASSLVTDANSALSGGGHMQRSASINTESYIRLPASPLSFSSNNLSISGSSIVDCSTAVQHGNHHDRSVQQGNLNTGSLQGQGNGNLQVPISGRVSNTFLQDPHLSHLQKKPRMEIKQEDIVQQQVLQQIFQRQDSMQFQNGNPQLQSLLQQQRMRQQQKILQSMPHLQRAQHQQQQQQQMQQQMQLRQQMQQQALQPTSPLKRSFDSGVCSRRLMQYLFHQQRRPPDNNISYWKKFVAEYFSPRAKKRWCLSLYNNVGQHAPGVFPQAAMEAWHCDICGAKSGRGFEGTFEVLPRLNEIKFGSGVIDELLFLDLPREFRFPSGIMMVEYTNAVQETIYEQLRVVREGQLRISFTQDLKILSWEFCARRHEELLPRRVVAPQVNHVLQVVHKYQTAVSESASDGISHQDLQTNNNMVVSAGRQLIKCLEFPSLNDLGFSKRYIRCLQISEVVNSMKDLIDLCRENKVGPIEALRIYPRQAATAKLSGSAQAALALSNYQNLLSRQNSANSLTQDSPTFNKSSQSFVQGSTQNSPSAHLLPPQNLFQQQMLQLLQDSSSNTGQSLQQHSFAGQGNIPATLLGYGNNSLTSLPPVPSRSNSFRGTSNSVSSNAVGNSGMSPKISDFPQHLHMQNNLVNDMGHAFVESYFLNNDVDETMGYSWKA